MPKTVETIENITSVTVDTQEPCCISCGEFLYGKHDQRFTTLNHVGPYCVGCIIDAEENEIDDNSQFGVGA